MKKSSSLLTVCVGLLVAGYTCYAAVPVIDGQSGQVMLPQSETMRIKTAQAMREQPSQPNALVSDDDQTNLDSHVDVNQLIHQMAYLQQLNLPRQIQQLQASIQDLRGIVEMQGHEIQDLKDRQRKLYADLNQRLNAMSGNSSAAANNGQPLVNQNAPDQKNLYSLSDFHPMNQQNTAAASTAVQANMASLDAPSVNSSASQNNSSAGPLALDKEAALYQQAITFIKQKQYSDAIDTLNGYLNQYPSGAYAPNAHYWLGELYTVSGNTASSIHEFQSVTKHYAKSNKAPDAWLRLGSIYYDKAQLDKAKEAWNTVLSKYPQSSAARVAQLRLTQLKKIQ